MTVPFDRARLCRARRIVVKIGSSTLASDPNVYGALARSIAGARKEGKSIVLVSSGAIALGTARLGLRARPREMSKLQAAAAAGQTALMRAYEEAFEPLGIPVAQVLLTHADLADRTRSNNARAALAALWSAGAVPILNENDSVSVEEIKFGDNDQLAALVAPLVDAELVVLLSDVEGLLDGQGKRIAVVHDVASEAVPHVRKGPVQLARAHSAPSSLAGTSRGPGTGGMGSKVEAARRATLAGADVVVADARAPGTLDAVLRGDDVGTVFVASSNKLSARRYWIAFTLKPRGTIVLDAGATDAVRAKCRSILPVGVVGVRGDFRAGDAVRIVGVDGSEIGRGLARAGVVDAARIAGDAQGKRASAPEEPEVLVHRDDLAIW